MRRAMLAALAMLALGAPAAQAADTQSTCATGSAADAAVALYGSGTELESTETIAGARTALALEPRIAPATRRRMIDAGDRWCDATSGFNRAWTGGDRRAMATAYARMAAAPYFDDVTIESVDETAPGTFAITTHARTNGVVAAWVVATDDGGIQAARWNATAFAQAPFTAQIEGLTALPGAEESYDRVTGGALEAARGLPEPAPAVAGDPGLGVEYTGPDGFRIVISYGDGRVAPQLGQDTGVRPVDVIRNMERAARTNYEEFLSWGLTKGWSPAEVAGAPDTGYIYINDALSLYCLACVFIANDFQIHMLSEVYTALQALGYKYPNVDKAFSNIVGHEMFHNFQNRYVKPGPLTGVVTGGRKTTSTAYSEGTARFQETLHDYSDVSHYTTSLVYAQDSNGCNGFDGSGTSANMDNAMASGVFGKSYNSCYFWMPFYASEGNAGLLRLMTETMPAAAPEGDVHKEGIAAVEAASGDDHAVLLERFAVSALSGRGNVWGPFAGVGDPLDWSKYLEQWRPATIAAGEQYTRALSNGGLMARRLRETATVSLTGPAEARLFAVRDDGVSARVTPIPAAGGRVRAPRADETVHVVAAYPETGSASLTLDVR